MPSDSIPQLSLGTAALIIFLMCAGFVMLRGVMRMIVATLVLAVSAWIGFLVWENAPALSVAWIGKSVGWITTGLPIASFVTSFFLVRKITKAIGRPFGGDGDRERRPPATLARIAFRLFLALIPTSLFLLIGATLVHHTGAIAEVRSAAGKPHGPATPLSTPPEPNLKSAVEALIPQSWLKALDPFADPDRVSLAKIITAQSESPLRPVIDPKTGQAIPRAIIVNNPELQDLAREGKFGTLLRHPLLTKALNDPKIQALLKNLQL